MTRKPKDEVAAKGAYWKKRIAEWERSGQSQRVFCSERDLALSTFQWWRTKLRRAQAQEAAASFLPLAFNSAAPAAVIDVELRSKTRVRLEGEAALRALDAVVARIR
jgi:hypothetical protein